MKKIRWITGILSIVCLLYFVVTGTDVLTVYGASDGSVTYVVDQADILSPQEEQAIETRIEEMSQKWKQDFVVVTTNDAEGKDSEEYADDYYDYHGYQENGVLYLVDLDNGNVWISTSGSMIRFLTDSRIDRVIDAGYSELKSKNYGEGFLAMLDQTEDYMQPWTFTSDDGRFEMDFLPIMDRAACTDAKLICSDQHQVFGLFTGRAVLDDGRVVEVKDFLGFAEKVFNKW